MRKNKYYNHEIVESAMEKLGLEDYIDPNKVDYSDSNRTPEYILIMNLVDVIRPDISKPLSTDEYDEAVSKLILEYQVAQEKFKNHQIKVSSPDTNAELRKVYIWNR